MVAWLANAKRRQKNRASRPGFFVFHQKTLVNHFLFGCLPKLRNFVLQYQFASLKFMHFELVYGGVELFLLDLPFKRHMAAFEFGEMALHGHAQLLSMLERQDCDTKRGSRKRENFFTVAGYREAIRSKRRRNLSKARFAFAKWTKERL
jgi:hypothetical protein